MLRNSCTDLYLFCQQFLCDRLELSDREDTNLHWRIRTLMTFFIWLSFGFYFTSSARAEVYKCCPDGKRSMLGGNRKRNVLSLEDDFYLLNLICFMNVLDSCLVFTFQAYHQTLGKYCISFSRRTSSFDRCVLGGGAAVRPHVQPELHLPGAVPSHCTVAQQTGLLRVVEQPPAPGEGRATHQYRSMLGREDHSGCTAVPPGSSPGGLSSPSTRLPGENQSYV